jgi:hypothetical protein
MFYPAVMYSLCLLTLFNPLDSELTKLVLDFLNIRAIDNDYNMKNLIYEATKKTPKILFDYESGVFEISGRSIPENAFEFFNPVLDWLDIYSSAPQEKTLFKVYLEYYNTSSSKYLLDIFKKFEIIYRRHPGVLIEWYYDSEDDDSDDDMLKAGTNFSSILRVPFVTKEYSLLEFNSNF